MIESYVDEESGQKLWRVKVFVKDKFRRQLSRYVSGIQNERKAKELEFKLKRELLDKVDAVCVWTWGTWYKECLKRMQLSLKKSTIVAYEGRIARWIPKEWDDKLLTSFEGADVHNLIYEVIGDRLSTGGHWTILKLVRRIFEMAVEEGHLTKNPARAVKVSRKAKEGRVLTATEAQLLLDKAREANHPFWGVWTFALLSGMRSGEMYAIRWTDVDLMAGTMSVSRQWTSKDGICPPKWGSSRMVPISDDFREFLIEWRSRYKGFEKTLYDTETKMDVTHADYILPQVREWRMGLQADVLKDFCRTIGVTEIKFHDLRATFITNLLVQGAELLRVMMIVGHRKLATTDKYVRKAGVPVQGVTNVLGYQSPKFDVVRNVIKFQKNTR